MRQHSSHAQSGFTLLEILLSVVMIAGLSMITAPLFMGMLTRNDLDLATSTTVQSLRRAQLLSQAVQDDAQWGVKVESSNIVIFKGPSYATRTVALDEVYTMPSTIGTSGTTEIVFSKLTGLPSTTGTITLSNAGDTRQLTINAKGMISF